MQDFDLQVVASKSVKGVFALVSRTFLVQVVGIIANLILTIYLDPSSFGIFFIVSSILIFLNYFQDIGLAASLIQKKEEPTNSEFRNAFTVQQILVLAVVIPAAIFSGKIAGFYGLDTQGQLLLLALLFSLFTSSLRTIPTIILERKLDFNRLVIPQIAENLIYNIALIICAIAGLGVSSFTIAVILRSVAGLILVYVIQPWEIGFAFDLATLKRLLSFGLPFQANSILALIKDDLLNIYIGKLLPLAQVGYIGFSQKWAYLPLRLVMDNVIKITFPSYSRLQHDKEALRLAIEKSLFLVSFMIFPIVGGLILLSPYFIEYVPRYEKWQPALLSLGFFSLSTIFSSISTPLTNFFNAIGKVKITLYFMVLWTILTWIITIPLIGRFGFNGVAFSSFLVSLSSIIVIIISKRYINFSVSGPVIRQLIAALVMAMFIYMTRGMVKNLPLLLIEISLAGAVYLLFLLIVAKEELFNTTRYIIKNIRK